LDERDIRHRASQAQDLLNSDAFKAAMDTVSRDAMNALVTCDGSDTKEVLRLQAGALACQHIEETLNGWILAAASLPKPDEPTVTNDPGVI